MVPDDPTRYCAAPSGSPRPSAWVRMAVPSASERRITTLASAWRNQAVSPSMTGADASHACCCCCRVRASSSRAIQRTAPVGASMHAAVPTIVPTRTTPRCATAAMPPRTGGALPNSASSPLAAPSGTDHRVDPSSASRPMSQHASSRRPFWRRHGTASTSPARAIEPATRRPPGSRPSPSSSERCHSVRPSLRRTDTTREETKPPSSPTVTTEWTRSASTTHGVVIVSALRAAWSIAIMACQRIEWVSRSKHERTRPSATITSSASMIGTIVCRRLRARRVSSCPSISSTGTMPRLRIDAGDHASGTDQASIQGIAGISAAVSGATSPIAARCTRAVGSPMAPIASTSDRSTPGTAASSAARADHAARSPAAHAASASRARRGAGSSADDGCMDARRSHAEASSARASWSARPASRSIASRPASVAANRVTTSTRRSSASHSRACAPTSLR